MMSDQTNLSRIRVVLVETSHPGNIGAAARAMKVMGLDRLYLVRPKLFPHPDATAMASGALDVLENAVVCDTLSDALVGTVYSIATTARERELSHRVFPAREAAKQALSKTLSGDVAIVFGPERTGLSVKDASLASVLSRISTGSSYASLNLGQAVQVFAYELLMALNLDEDYQSRVDVSELARHEDVELMYEHLEDVLFEIDFLKEKNPGKLVQRLRRMFARINLEKDEVGILRGILGAIQKKRR
jgi:tRNA/rRNA methyltransferase